MQANRSGLALRRSASARDLAGLDARGAGVQRASASRRPRYAPLDVGVPATGRTAVRVRDVVAEARPLAADVAVGSHGSLQRLQMHLRLIPACRDPDRTRRAEDLSGVARGDGPISIGQPEQHTTTAPVQRNYHGCSGPPPAALFRQRRPTGLRCVPRPAAPRRRRCRRCRRRSTPRGAHLVRARAGRAGAGPRGDRRDQRLPGGRRGHRHQPLSDLESAAAAVEAVFDGHDAGRRRSADPPRRRGRAPWPTAR